MISRQAALLRRAASASCSHSAAATTVRSSSLTLSLRHPSTAAGAGACLAYSTAKPSSLARNFSSQSPSKQATAASSADDAATNPSKSPETHFIPYSHSHSHHTLLPTPLPPDVADKQAQLRKKIISNYKSYSRDQTMSGLSYGDLSGLTMSNADEVFYPASKSVEHISILKACIGTGLITRAHKLFTDLRNQAQLRTDESWEIRKRISHDSVPDSAPLNSNNLHEYESPLEIWTYNSMLQAYMRKAYQSETLEGTSEWLGRAWDLWKNMQRSSQSINPNQPPSADPTPTASSFAIMARGVVTLQRSGRYPATAPSLEQIIDGSKRLDVSLESIFTSSVFNPQLVEDADEPTDSAAIQAQDKPREGEVDAMAVLQSLVATASEIGNTAVIHELDTVQSILEGHAAEMQAASQNSQQFDPLKDVPELMPVRGKLKPKQQEFIGQQGQVPFNLISLKENLSIVQQARLNISDPYERQKWLEHSALDAARKRLEHSVEMLEEIGLGSSGVLQTKQLQVWMWDWYNKLQETITTDIARIRAAEDDVTGPNNTAMESQLLPFLCLLPPSKMALIAILELMRMAGNGGVADGMKTTRALLTVGRSIETEYHAEVVRKNPQIFQNAHYAQNVLKKKGLLDVAARKEIKAWQEKMEDDGILSQIPKWTQVVRVRIGSFLVQHLMQVATVHRQATDRDGVLWEEDQPAFYSTYQYLGGKKLGVLKLNDVIAKRLDKDSFQETLHPRHLPMLVPPKPWTSHDSGGYYSVRQSAMRFKDSAEQGSYLRASSDNGDLDTVLTALDVLGQTAWKINKPIFDVMLQVWNSGQSIADMPSVEMETHEPEKPASYDHDIKARSVYLHRLKQWTLQRSSNHSQRCDVNYKLEIARSFIGERFYFPHNMDFRGRAYPMPPHLNHIGNDLCRGLLVFAESKPLGPAGLRWLRIHLANVFGYDKASFAEREQFAIDREADLRDSVNDPLGGNKWWLNADDPWQCLATCIELKNALDHPEGPEAFESHLPVHQDGTCNGLQHYAALGGDLNGAKQVNLAGGDRPADVYSGVADLVIKVLDDDAAKGDRLAQVLQGKVTRKVVKQTVMTTVYGVTFIGAKNQVMRQLADRGDVPAEDLFPASSYLAKNIMSCIGNLFAGANQIQSWLSESARMIAKSIPPERIEEAMRPYEPSESTTKRADAKGFARDPARADRIVKEQMTSVIWTTALGLPVVQPYRKVKKRQVATAMQTVFIQDPLSNAEVSPAKQASAFPPNFIHSLDATHMILTALECHAAGLTFASVHDSYWTHASDIDTMSEMIRETFVRLHTQDILYRLREEFLQRYSGHKVPVVTAFGTKSKRRKSLEKGEAGGSDLVHVLPEEQVNKLKGETGELIIKLAETSKGSDVDEEDIDKLELEEMDPDVKPAKKSRSKKGRKTKASKGEEAEDTWESRFRAKFVDLADILPQIPEKGSFDVNEIKNSAYFFS